jgi:hypothetical protein
VARGLAIVDGMVEVPHVCPHLNTEHKCDLHGDEKPQACRDSPYNTDCLPATCGFTFTDGDQGG